MSPAPHFFGNPGCDDSWIKQRFDEARKPITVDEIVNDANAMLAAVYPDLRCVNCKSFGLTTEPAPGIRQPTTGELK